MGSCRPDFSACQASGSEAQWQKPKKLSQWSVPAFFWSLPWPSSHLMNIQPGAGERVDGEGVRETSGTEQKMVGIKQSTGGSGELLPATWQADASRWASLSTDSKLAASSACNRHPSPVEGWRVTAVCFIPIHVSRRLRRSSSLPASAGSSAGRAGGWAVGRGTRQKGCSLWVNPWGAPTASPVLLLSFVPAFWRPFFFSPLQSISLQCLGRKGCSGSCFSAVKVGHLPKMGRFSKKLNKKKIKPMQCFLFCPLHHQPHLFSVFHGVPLESISWGRNWWSPHFASELAEGRSELKEPFLSLGLL